MQEAVTPRVETGSNYSEEGSGSVSAEDRMAAICVAMESALNDKRFEEAAMLRNTFLKIGGSSSTA